MQSEGPERHAHPQAPAVIPPFAGLIVGFVLELWFSFVGHARQQVLRGVWADWVLGLGCNS